MNLRSFIDSYCNGTDTAHDCNYRRVTINESIYNSLSAYTNRRFRLTLHRVFKPDFLLGYQHFLLSTSCCENTVAFYMNNLRGICTRAVELGKLKANANLFEKLITRFVATQKRSLPVETICKLMSVDLSAHAHLEASRNRFMLSLHLQGIPFVDLCYLKAGNLSNDRIIYCRRKTAQPIEVRLTPEALSYLKKLLNTDPGSPYLLNIITRTGKAGYRQYQSALRKMNRHLKDIARLAGIDENLSSYCSRHSWASIAYHAGVSAAIVGQGLGHKTEEVTRTYLSNFEPDYLLEANLTVAFILHSVIARGGVGGTTPEQAKEGKEKARQIKERIQKTIDQRPFDLRPLNNAGYNRIWTESQRCKPIKRKSVYLY